MNPILDADDDGARQLTHNTWSEDSGSSLPELQHEVAEIQRSAVEDTTIDRATAAHNDAVPSEVPIIKVPKLHSAAEAQMPSEISTPLGSSPARSSLSPAGSIRRNASPSLHPFERRLQPPRSLSAQSVARRALFQALPPSHSRSSSISGFIGQLANSNPDSEKATPQKESWEVMKWTHLRKLSHQAFSEAGRRTHGHPTCIAIASHIAVGTSKGIILLFDYQQTLKNIIGQGTTAAESGSVLAIALSADQLMIAGGHASGAIFTWEIARPSKPDLQIPPIGRSSLATRTADGHVSGNPVLHLDFLGMYRTALVSADSTGMAFSHVASRGLGIGVRNVKSTRLLGRYPVLQSAPLNPPPKPSAVLAFASLALSSVEQATDDMGLVAILTPHLLVVVSTIPIAQTQHKAARPKEATIQPMLTGALAWFPAVKNKGLSAGLSKASLAYSWSQSLELVELHVHAVDQKETPKPPELSFVLQGHWKSEEAIVALQWLNRSVLVVLTASQRLIILDKSLKVADSLDLIPRHIYHQSLFFEQLQPLADFREEAGAPLRVVPDAYYMSFKAYKGRLFVLGMNEIAMGTLSNWADRLTSTVGANNYIGAIKLATMYYLGDVQCGVIGLPDEAETRHALLEDRMLDIMSASLNYTFENQDEEDTDIRSRENLEALVEACFNACLRTENVPFLFEQVYESYSDASVPDVFLYALERRVIEGNIGAVPTSLLQDMTAWFVAHGYNSRLEDLFCALRTDSMDLDRVTTLCKENDLFDALLYVWNNALGDYITPFMELLTRLDDVENNKSEAVSSTAFSYMAMTFTGRTFPHGALMAAQEASSARASLYNFVFSPSLLQWPGSNATVFRTRGLDGLNYPYLRFLLHLNTSEFMSMLNEAFEDAYLNRNTEILSPNQPPFLLTRFDRQQIVDILLNTMTELKFSKEEMAYLHIFIARNVPKFPQFILIPGSAIKSTIVGLCSYPDENLADECQLSVEYLMSMYRPNDLQDMIPLFEKAGFYRVLKTVFRANRQWLEWLQACFDDPDNPSSVFDTIRDLLRHNIGVNQRQLAAVKALVVEHAQTLVELDISQTTQLLTNSAQELVDEFLNKLGPNPRVHYNFLHVLFDSTNEKLKTNDGRHLEDLLRKHTEVYLELMCTFAPHRVAEVVGQLPTGDLKLEEILPVIERAGVVDAAVVLMQRAGLLRNALNRLLNHLQTLQTGLSTSLRKAAEKHSDQHNTAAWILLEDVQRYGKLGIWLCQSGTERQSAITPSPLRGQPGSRHNAEEDMSESEMLWLDLIDSLVELSRAVSSSEAPLERDVSGGSSPNQTASIRTTIVQALHILVQQTFTALLAVSSSNTHSTQLPQTAVSSRLPSPISFLRILRAFLSRAAKSSPSLADLRHVISDIFAAYSFEESVLALASHFIDKEVFGDVANADKTRRRGWPPSGQACNRCGKRTWGTGAGEDIWLAWEAGRKEREAKRTERWKGKASSEKPREKLKGKSRSAGLHDVNGTTSVEPNIPDELVVFACGHLWHRRCLRAAWVQRKEEVKVAKDDATNEGYQEHEAMTTVIRHAEDDEVAGFQCPLCV